MTVTLPDVRADTIFRACVGLKSKSIFTIRELAQVIGQLVAAFPAAQWGPPFYRNLEKLKSSALKQHKGNVDALITMHGDGQVELDWWIQNVRDTCVFCIEQTKNIR